MPPPTSMPQSGMCSKPGVLWDSFPEPQPFPPPQATVAQRIPALEKRAACPSRAAANAPANFLHEDHVVLAGRQVSGGGGRGQRLEAQTARKAAASGSGQAVCGPPGGTLWALRLLSRPRCWPLGLGSRQRACHLPGAQAAAGAQRRAGQAAQSLTCSPSLGRHRLGPGCPRCWGAFRPWGDTELRSLLRPRQGARGEGAEPGVRAASPPGLAYCPPPAPQGWGSCPLGGPPAAPPPPTVEVRWKPAAPAPSALQLAPSQAVGPSGQCSGFPGGSRSADPSSVLGRDGPSQATDTRGSPPHRCPASWPPR